MNTLQIRGKNVTWIGRYRMVRLKDNIKLIWRTLSCHITSWGITKSRSYGPSSNDICITTSFRETNVSALLSWSFWMFQLQKFFAFFIEWYKNEYCIIYKIDDSNIQRKRYVSRKIFYKNLKNEFYVFNRAASVMFQAKDWSFLNKF